MTSRRDFLVTTGLGVLAPAQLVAQPKPVRVGILSPRKLAESSYAPHLVRRLEELPVVIVEEDVIDLANAHRHDPAKLAAALMRLLQEDRIARPRMRRIGRQAASAS